MTDSNLLYQAIQQRPDDPVLQKVYADSLEEEGLYELADAWRRRFELKGYSFFEFQNYYIYHFNNGDGFGFGVGNDNGFGYGFGYDFGYDDRSGNFYCYCYGSGYGYGGGSGHADCYGDGYCNGIPSQYLSKKIKEPIVVGKNMLIYTGSGIVWIGKVAEITVNGYRLINAGVLFGTRSVEWYDIAKGNDRESIIYRESMIFSKSQAPNGELFIGKLISESYEWIGELPSTDIG